MRKAKSYINSCHLGAAGVVVTLALAPWLAALGVIASMVTKCTMEVEKTAEV